MMNPQSLDNLRMQFQRTASSLAAFNKTAQYLEKQAYYQGQFDILSTLLTFTSVEGMMDWIKRKREEVQLTMERSSQVLKIPKFPLQVPEQPHPQQRIIPRNNTIQEEPQFSDPSNQSYQIYEFEIQQIDAQNPQLFHQLQQQNQTQHQQSEWDCQNQRRKSLQRKGCFQNN